ncbi:DUF3267 domain-containing protein [Anaerotignum sp. MB30-C6]|uniref:DUF3267 domain-containing protein n=1 Tax=Anaerotignum sp. MB30-C6 TaxID=3070814 RepID=UPI0027DD2D9A|nr:DUF3267 domain-containing protein [Anaerotignum sp. MB30-C6]WMI81179.1 DUF3267 domain-containing protein [Anaerotignum sp. MB30-C6]
MRYMKNLPKTDEKLREKLLSEGWKKIREPRSLGLAILLSFPLALLFGGLVLWLAYILRPSLFGVFATNSLEITLKFNLQSLLFVLSIYGYMFLHELIHALFIPNFYQSDRTFFGINGLFGFVFTTEPIKKGRFLVISVMPFILLSIIPLFLLDLLGLLNWYIVGLCFINATGSCVDFLNMFLIGFQVKRKHSIINNGFETYFSPTKEYNE